MTMVGHDGKCDVDDVIQRASRQRKGMRSARNLPERFLRMLACNSAGVGVGKLVASNGCD